MENIEYILHREKIALNMVDDSVLVLFANQEELESPNPNRNFLYATGITEDHDILIIKKKDEKVTSTLFIEAFDEVKAKWVGRGLNMEEATSLSGVLDIKYLDSFEQVLKGMLGNDTTLYLDLKDTKIDSKTIDFEHSFANSIKANLPYVNIKQGRGLLQSARTIKTRNEVEEIKKAIAITKNGILALLDNMASGIYEYQLESYFDQAIKYSGATSYSFNTIAASGVNSCCLHYSANNSLINQNEIILFDLGATKNYYCADISRTFPVNGKFSDRQKLIYNIVLNGQKLVFDSIKPGLTTRDLNQILVKYYEVELKKIGLINEPKEVFKYYFHGVSHHLGLDCHDLCDYTPIEAGAVITVEPGLYIPEENIGVRIEDDALVTEDGAINLSSDIIKTVEDIEKYLSKK